MHGREVYVICKLIETKSRNKRESLISDKRKVKVRGEEK